MAENRLQSQETASPAIHRLIFFARCECCEKSHFSQQVIVELPPPETPGLIELLATGSDNPTDHWVEIIRMQHQCTADPLCDGCAEAIKELMDGED